MDKTKPTSASIGAPRPPQLAIVRPSGRDRVLETIENLLATTKKTRLTGLTFVAIDDKGNRYSGAAGVFEDDQLKLGGALLYGAMNALFSE